MYPRSSAEDLDSWGLFYMTFPWLEGASMLVGFSALVPDQQWAFRTGRSPRNGFVLLLRHRNSAAENLCSYAFAKHQPTRLVRQALFMFVSHRRRSFRTRTRTSMIRVNGSIRFISQGYCLTWRRLSRVGKCEKSDVRTQTFMVSLVLPTALPDG